MHVGCSKVKEADPDFSFAAAFNFLDPALRRLCFRQATTQTSDVEIDRLSESAKVVRGHVGGRCRSGVRHDRTIHTFDSHRNAIWVGDFFVHRL